jgi:hypothetical protein
MEGQVKVLRFITQAIRALSFPMVAFAVMLAFVFAPSVIESEWYDWKKFVREGFTS